MGGGELCAERAERPGLFAPALRVSVDKKTAVVGAFRCGYVGALNFPAVENSTTEIRSLELEEQGLRPA